MPTTSLSLSGSLWSEAARRIGRDRLTMCAITVLATLTLLAAAADGLATYVFHTSLMEQDLVHLYAPPDGSRAAAWLGLDELGRSQIVRLLYGARISLGVAVGAMLLNLIVGVPLGLAAGYTRGRVDDVTQWLIATLQSIPRLFLLVLISALFGPGPVGVVVVLGVLAWPAIALYVRGQTLSLREREFVIAARVVGASYTRIVARHVMPNVLPMVVVLSAIDVSALILTESALSFLGLGIQPPIPSWGNMLTPAAAALQRAPWLVMGPGVAIFVTVLCLYLVGDGARDALDPTSRNA